MYRLQVLLIALFSLAASADQQSDAPINVCHMTYPNIAGELLLENDQVVVQRFTIEPGQWEGIHRHPPHQLYIQLTDGKWTYRSDGNSQDFSMAAGDVSWNEGATTLGAQHESRNAGEKPISYIWVGVKPACLEQD
jgi:quercetin dioxygenase-like cupin family protein